VKPIIERELPLDQAAQAHELVERGAVTGRLVLRPNL
jgi:NADPH:quinone reductase-like Zn-dependent oxidoreductase